MKKFTAFVLTAVLAFNAFTPFDAEVPQNAAVSAYAQAAVAEYGGWHESAYIIWNNDDKPTEAKVYYKKSTDSTYTQIDSELIRPTADGGRADIVGIAKGSYDIKVETADGAVLEQKNVEVSAYDRSGYAHFNYNSGVGAYNDDGTPKSDADIIYVTNATKNTVEYNGKKGIANILADGTKLKNPLIVRIIGKVDTQTRDKDGTKTTDSVNGVVAINGLQDVAWDDDSYFNMLDVEAGSNITVEGIGTDASVEKWGFTFKRSSSIEVRNLHFALYPEDACSFIGDQKKGECRNIWLHNCTFDKGENKYDLTNEKDKGDGDGSTDIVWSQYVTVSGNRFNDCHKTSLNGNGDSVKQYNITWHHNYFNNCGARLPLIRQANMHSYNNYFRNCGNCIDSRASAWVLSEANYFEKCSNAHIVRGSETFGNPIIKSYNDVLVDSGVNNNAKTLQTATDRAAVYTVSGNLNPYPNFDTNSEVFYYKDGKSDVELLQTAEEAKAYCTENAGVFKGGSDIPVVYEQDEKPVEEVIETVPVKLGTPEQGVISASETSVADGENSVTYRSDTDDYKITDHSTTSTTTWTVPFAEQSSGKLVVQGRLVPLVAASKWAMLQIRGGESAVAALAADADKTLCLKAGENYYKTGIGINAGTNYSYTFVIDFGAKTAALTLNGITVSAPIEASKADNVYFMTAVKPANRDMIVSLPDVGMAAENSESTTQASDKTTVEATTETTTEATTETTTEATTEATTQQETGTTAEGDLYLLGDVDLNGKIEANDSVFALQYTLNKNALDFGGPVRELYALMNADVNKDKKVDADDAARILQKALVSTFSFE